MGTAVAAVVEVTRVCKLCEIEKPINEFRFRIRWHLHVCDSCRRGQMREYHYKHWPEYYQKHKEVRKQRTREYYKEQKANNFKLYGALRSPEQRRYGRELTVAVRARNKELSGYAKTEREREQSRLLFASMRAKALGYYGNKCECCGEHRYAMLTFDHKNGNTHKPKIHGVGLVYDVIREFEETGYPNSKYRILCWNCNLSRGFYKYCPHELGHSPHSYTGKAIKLEMISAYGGRCVLCGEAHWEFLTIDHINGGGHRHRAVVGSGLAFYRMLKKQNWPRDEYRLLCANCNCSVKRNKWSKGGN